MTDFLIKVEDSRNNARDFIASEKKRLSEQYFTPLKVALQMGGMFSDVAGRALRVLDPCCGVGNLAAAVLEIGRSKNIEQSFVLIESDDFLVEDAVNNFKDFSAVQIIKSDFFDVFKDVGVFDRIVMNPPYSKIHSSSAVAKKCKEYLGYSETNLYSAFVACCVSVLAELGELVAIIPRSFCNGPLFKNFRKFILDNSSISEMYLFDSRKVFWDSRVVQEVLILKLVKRDERLVKISHERSDGVVVNFFSDKERIVFPGDSNKVIHVPHALGDDELLSKMARFPQTLEALGLKASTGKVVDFRCFNFLKIHKDMSSVYMVYQDAVSTGAFVDCTKLDSVRPRFFQVTDESERLLLPRSNYIVVRRISFKESPTRISASPLLVSQFKGDTAVAIDNHLNYIWRPKGELSVDLCIALVAYMSTATVDKYVRRFSGHTQINAADLNSLPVPSIDELENFYSKNKRFSISRLIELAQSEFFS